MEKVEEPEECLCGHFPITEVFILENKTTEETVRIGSVCVNKFIQKNKNFDGYKKIIKDPSKSVNSELLEFAFKKKWITHDNYKFYSDILRKRKLSQSQIQYKSNINAKIINHIKRLK